MQGSAQHKIDFDLDLDAVAADQQLGFARILSRNASSLESAGFQAVRRLAETLCDAIQCLLARQGLVGKDKIEIDRETRHIAYEKVDGGAAL